MLKPRYLYHFGYEAPEEAAAPVAVVLGHDVVGSESPAPKRKRPTSRTLNAANRLRNIHCITHTTCGHEVRYLVWTSGRIAGSLLNTATGKWERQHWSAQGKHTDNPDFNLA